MSPRKKIKTEESCNDDNLQDQLLNQNTNDDSTSVLPSAIVPSEPREDPLQGEFLTKFTFKELQATRRLQSIGVGSAVYRDRRYEKCH